MFLDASTGELAVLPLNFVKLNYYFVDTDENYKIVFEVGGTFKLTRPLGFPSFLESGTYETYTEPPVVILEVGAMYTGGGGAFGSSGTLIQSENGARYFIDPSNYRYDETADNTGIFVEGMVTLQFTLESDGNGGLIYYNYNGTIPGSPADITGTPEGSGSYTKVPN